MPVVAQTERKVAAALQRAGLAGRGATIVVGVSGGADSSTLLYSLNRLRQSCQVDLHVAHLNHDFRGEEADEDARFVEALAHELGLPVSVEKRDPMAYQRERHISSFEQGAREMRYEFLSALANGLGAPAVAVGHTLDDQAETVLLHILRGTGLHGLRGMTETAPWPWPPGLDAPTLFRPLLEVTKAETVEYCRELGRDFRQDSGNSLFRFARNRVRQELLPWLASDFNPRVRESLVRLATTASLDLDFLEQELARVWPEVAVPDPAPAADGVAAPQQVAFYREALGSLHPALLRLALRRAYVAVNGDARRLRENHLRAMTELVTSGRTAGALVLPGGLVFEVSARQVAVAMVGQREERPFPELGGPHSISINPAVVGSEISWAGPWRVTVDVMERGHVDNLRPPNDFVTYLNPEALSGGFVVRNRLPGDRFQPLGMQGEKSLHDFLIDAKVPQAWRDHVPLVVGETKASPGWWGTGSPTGPRWRHRQPPHPWCCV